MSFIKDLLQIYFHYLILFHFHAFLMFAMLNHMSIVTVYVIEKNAEVYRKRIFFLKVHNIYSFEILI